MQFKRTKTGKYETECGRFTIVNGDQNSQWSRKFPWKIFVNSQFVSDHKTLSLAKKATEHRIKNEQLALAAEQLDQQRKECIASADTCPSGVDWLEWDNLRTGDNWTREKLADKHETLSSLAKLENLLDANDLGEFTISQYVDTHLVDEYQQTNRGSSALYCGQAVIVLEFCEDSDRAAVVVDGNAFHYSYPTRIDSEFEIATQAVADMVMDSMERNSTLASILSIELGRKGYQFSISEKMGIDGQPTGEPITEDNFPGLFANLSRAVV